MRYTEWMPPSSLSLYVESLWGVETDADDPPMPAHVVPPDGAVSITLTAFPGAPPLVGLMRPATEALRRDIPRGALFAGARLRPGVAGSLLRVDIGALAPGFSPFHAVRPDLVEAFAAPAGADIEALKAGVLSGLEALIGEAAPIDPVAARAAAALMAGETPIAALAARSGLSERQFRRRFRAQTGLSPMEFARLRRVRTACVRFVRRAAAPLTEASLEAGFAGEATMAREFRAVFGASSALALAYLRQIENAAAAAALRMPAE